MKNNLLMDFSIESETATIMVKREFAASRNRVWEAWTQPELIDQWWAPKPWKARTKIMDFRAGGMWLYSMIGPDGTEIFSRADYQEIVPMEIFKGMDAFCDSEGVINNEFPRTRWSVSFSSVGENTLIDVVIRHESLSDLEKYIEMGFREGFTSALENLDEILDK